MKNEADQYDVIVGNRVRVQRKALGLTQADLAVGLGITFQQVQKYETGSNRISCSRLVYIAAMLKTPVVNFFEGLDAEDAVAPAEPSADAMAVAFSFDKIADAKVRSNVMQFIRALTSDAVKP